ncbi:MAG: ATP-binding cassette domain-containing protein [Planctomycetia bacterium]|nr:ATP-binding cassette domain-containing protein [Planctomycetia bacterium]
MKATGWNTLEVLELITFEQLLISLLGATIAIIVSILWIRVFNGAFIGQFFISETTLCPSLTCLRNSFRCRFCWVFLCLSLNHGREHLFLVEGFNRITGCCNEIMIRMENIRKWYNANTKHEVRAVEEVNLTIAKNSFVVLKGPSGSGKTTLLNIIGTLDRPTTGKVFINEEKSPHFPISPFLYCGAKRSVLSSRILCLFPDYQAGKTFRIRSFLWDWHKRTFQRAKTLLDMMDLGESDPYTGRTQRRTAAARCNCTGADK